ncbi:MAG: hypothetical protein HYT13_03075 [Candidatus Liptonbacteria bacterium]|nr:hypothetical protein [Candidatus Liptonbacteria bacterium]
MSLLIKNVALLGESPKTGDKAVDVFVRGDKIAAIGRFGDKKAKEVIDGGGSYLSPGFIDVNTNSDHYLSLLQCPGQEGFLKQGVTTIVGGLCGSSLAPLLYGSLESIQKWASTSEINVNWHSLKELFQIFEKRPLGVNFATLIGHSTIRRALIGESLRELTKNELVVFGATLEKALKDGGFGLSTGLGYVHSRATPYSELKFLAHLVKIHHGVYATHLRKIGEHLLESVEETIKLAKETGVSTLVSHFLPVSRFEKEYKKAISEIQDLPTHLDFHFDLHPFDSSIVELYTFLPVWAQGGGIGLMRDNINDPWLQEKILKELPNVDAGKFIVTRAIGNESLVGRTLEELKDVFGVRDNRRVLIKLMVATQLRAIVTYKNINPELSKKAFLSKRSLLGSNAAQIVEGRKTAFIPERAEATFPTFLKMVAEEKIMPLEEAIKKIALIPAKKFNLKGRGEIREGYFADLTGFKNQEIKFVIVNGKVALRDGAPGKTLAGRALRHSV